MFKLHLDPGHGWLEITEADLLPLDMTERSFSRYSYKRGGHLYLEEDCDAPRFLERYRAVHGYQPELYEIEHPGRSHIRSFSHLHQ